MKWTNEDCSDCAYRVEHRCRRFPPTINSVWDAKTYPKVWFKEPDGISQYWQNACAEYKRR